MELRKPSKKLLGFASVLLALLSGCGPGIEEVDNEVEGKLGVMSQAIGYNGNDYLFVTTPKSWPEAQALCAISGYKLVTINDSNEESFLAQHESSFGQYNWWIGLNDRGIEGFFTWDGGASTYTNYYPSEPNNYNGAEDCVADRYRGDDGSTQSEQWNDWDCNRAFPFICERAPEPTTNRGSFSYTAANTANATVNVTGFAVHLRAGQVFTVGTCGVPGASRSGDTYLRVNNPYGQEVAANDDAGGACGFGSNISIVVAVSGTHTIRAGCYSSGSCNGTVAYNISD
ncbi:C-type lectin domain-containing protein [Archangium sp.]|uniref:C-type lectin domain-containing protein n=1 Tax=Archangium sp. TaxID=1872627 RepID=UPI00286D57F8|nr:C-type lectin domain-containing protein [Archangium sp.]